MNAEAGTQKNTVPSLPGRYATLSVRNDDGVVFVDINAPPMNLLGPALVHDLVALIERAEAHDEAHVLVFRSADPDYFISHVDVTNIAEYRAQAAKLVGVPSIALLFRYLSASSLVSIAQIEGRARGAGSEFALACDMRFGARESAILGQFEPAFGAPPGGGAVQHLTRLMGRDARWRRCWGPRTSTPRRPHATAGSTVPCPPPN